ncbi:hypothetical protein T265_04816 [Opisthorchis viverrini]|uniref:ATPase V1 complex subunit H C-terminal domain-containing protein n=1 Tax=Opisthorchis viverrini TaxID=6198 RepID=A0A074ZYF8_OPIVI|nr:hypothetical protein T265_04816 [Opisthorchis viverrini]KER28360.1 hypothetical protein T265_04816 [Opisthorchis viverrini]
MYQASRIVAKFACWSRQLMEEKELMYYLNWLRDQLLIPKNEYDQTVARNLQMMLRIPKYRARYAEVGGIETIVEVLGDKRTGLQLQYQLIFCLWCMSFDLEHVQRMCRSPLFIPTVADIFREAEREKIIRISLALFRRTIGVNTDVAFSDDDDDDDNDDEDKDEDEDDDGDDDDDDDIPQLTVTASCTIFEISRNIFWPITFISVLPVFLSEISPKSQLVMRPPGTMAGQDIASQADEGLYQLGTNNRKFFDGLEKQLTPAERRTCGLSLVQCKVLRQLDLLRQKDYSHDPELTDDMNFLNEKLSASIQDVSSLEEYTTELKSGRLEWSPVHKSEKFWHENAVKFTDNNYEVIKPSSPYLTSDGLTFSRAQQCSSVEQQAPKVKSEKLSWFQCFHFKAHNKNRPKNLARKSHLAKKQEETELNPGGGYPSSDAPGGEVTSSVLSPLSIVTTSNVSKVTTHSTLALNIREVCNGFLGLFSLVSKGRVTSSTLITKSIPDKKTLFPMEACNTARMLATQKQSSFPFVTDLDCRDKFLACFEPSMLNSISVPSNLSETSRQTPANSSSHLFTLHSKHPVNSSSTRLPSSPDLGSQFGTTRSKTAYRVSGSSYATPTDHHHVCHTMDFNRVSSRTESPNRCGLDATCLNAFNPHFTPANATDTEVMYHGISQCVAEVFPSRPTLEVGDKRGLTNLEESKKKATLSTDIDSSYQRNPGKPSIPKNTLPATKSLNKQQLSSDATKLTKHSEYHRGKSYRILTHQKQTPVTKHVSQCKSNSLPSKVDRVKNSVKSIKGSMDTSKERYSVLDQLLQSFQQNSPATELQTQLPLANLSDWMESILSDSEDADPNSTADSSLLTAAIIALAEQSESTQDCTPHRINREQNVAFNEKKQLSAGLYGGLGDTINQDSVSSVGGCWYPEGHRNYPLVAAYGFPAQFWPSLTYPPELNMEDLQNFYTPSRYPSQIAYHPYSQVVLRADTYPWLMAQSRAYKDCVKNQSNYYDKCSRRSNYLRKHQRKLRHGRQRTRLW